jgi:RimJ/RimL family protein N-acetyltransferase
VALLPDSLGRDPLTLLRWRPEHVDALLATVTDSLTELRRWMPWAYETPTRSALRDVLAQGESLFDDDERWEYVLSEDGTDQLVGAAGVHRSDDPQRPEVGYWVRSDRTGRGYATTAAATLVDAAFTWVPGAERVGIRMDQANVASAAVPRKLGFALVGEEDREILTPGHTGRGFIWETSNDAWRDGGGGGPIRSA